MIFKRLALALAAAACLATAAAIALIALAFAFYELLANVLPPSGAAACLFFAAAIVAALAGLILMQTARLGRGGKKAQGRGQPPGAPAGLADSLADIVRDRPMAAAALAATVGWVLTRSPGLAGVLGTLISRPGRGRRD